MTDSKSCRGQGRRGNHTHHGEAQNVSYRQNDLRKRAKKVALRFGGESAFSLTPVGYFSASPFDHSSKTSVKYRTARRQISEDSDHRENLKANTLSQNSGEKNLWAVQRTRELPNAKQELEPQRRGIRQPVIPAAKWGHL